MNDSHTVPRILITIVLLFLFHLTASAVAPTEEAVAKWKANGEWEERVAAWQTFKQAGGCAPALHSPIEKLKERDKFASGGPLVTIIHVPVILVDFSDNVYTDGNAVVTTTMFDSLLFSDPDSVGPVNPTGSMTEYYLEDSYGSVYITGDVVGWYRMPKTYAYYVNGTEYGLTRSPELVRAAVDSADADLDYSQYDSDGDGFVDGVIVVHAGHGAEEGGDDIWSHRFSITPVTHDGKMIEAYTMNPEELGAGMNAIGVFCHEYGHILGLPDLYDINDDRRQVIGRWSLMASGNWLSNSKKPAHMDAWCKNFIGFLFFAVPSGNVYRQDIPAVEYNPVAYKLVNGTTGPNEYWVVENRQKMGFDAFLPGDGLCIYHVDETATFNNSNFLRYHVAMEQSDGLFQLEDTIVSQGDAGDPWPATPDADDFHNLSTPNSQRNVSNTVTKIGVWDITPSDSIMFADFDVTDYSRPYIELDGGSGALLFNDDPPRGDGDSVMEAGETIHFYCTVKNFMRGSYNPRATLTTNNSAVTITTNNVPLDGDLFTLSSQNTTNPIVLTIADSVSSVIDSFFLTITTDSVSGARSSGEFSKTFGFEAQVGATQILIVDDDRGDEYQDIIASAFARKRLPTRVWDKQSEGSPSGATLAEYNMVFWHTGDSVGNVLTANDMTAMQFYLDDGGNLLLSSASGIDVMDLLDSAFLANYFHVAANTSVGKHFIYNGVGTNDFGMGANYRNVQDVSKWYASRLLIPLSGAEASNTLPSNPPNGIIGVTHSGVHKTILLSFGIEFIDNQYDGTVYGNIDTLVSHAMSFFGGNATSVYDGHSFPTLPENFSLHQNYPNPFNPTTNISYTLRSTDIGKSSSKTTLAIYNVLGQRIRTLVDKIQAPGSYVVEWDGTTSSGNQVASGVYFYRLERADQAETRKMILVR